MMPIATATTVEVRPVTTRRESRLFVDYPNKLYRDVPQFVPAFYGDDLDDWDEKKNPAFSYCEGRRWLAWRDGEIVGRIGAILSHKANEKWGTKRMRFSQVDFIDDREVSAALMKAVEDYGRSKGMTDMVGPLGFTDMDPEGMLTHGFDQLGTMATIYNYPYYPKHFEAMEGYGGSEDMIAKAHNSIAYVKAEQQLEDMEFVLTFVKRMAGAKIIPIPRTIPDNLKEKLEKFSGRKR